VANKNTEISCPRRSFICLIKQSQTTNHQSSARSTHRTSDIEESESIVHLQTL
jgi:hypothetical protein